MMHAQSISLKETRAAWFQDIALVLLSGCLIGLCSKIAFHLPFTPVPITVQNTVVLFLALFLGSKRGSAAVACFLAQGLMGLPVFAGGASGLPILLGPRGGYLVGYLVAAFLVGWIAERGAKSLPRSIAALTAGSFAIYLFGASHLSVFVGAHKALLLGVAPFILGDVFKILVGLKLAERFRTAGQKK